MSINKITDLVQTDFPDDHDPDDHDDHDGCKNTKFEAFAFAVPVIIFLGFASQIRLIYKKKHADEIDWLWLASQIIIGIIMLIYGVANHIRPTIITCIVVITSIITLTILKFKYRVNSSIQKPSSV